jgi:hypothetical protein
LKIDRGFSRKNCISYANQHTTFSEGTMNPVGGNPVCGSVPLGRLKSRM